MNKVIDRMLLNYDLTTSYARKNALKEVVQEIVLCGLSRAGFFKEVAFYGGTALRIFYGLDRFSEDLDFSLLVKNTEFSLNKYIPVLEKEVRSYGLNFRIEEKIKTHDSFIKSAFLKGNTREHMLLFFNDEYGDKTEVLKIKFEVDVNPPDFATFERKFHLIPSPFEITLYDESSLFAGKLHAVICRSWKNRVKGRDLYDYVFYLSRRTKFNLKHLQARLIDSGFISQEDRCDLEAVKNMLYNKFATLDYDMAKQDVLPFIKNQDEVAIWSKDFFTQITEQLKAVE